jgi:hypothetical protein
LNTVIPRVQPTRSAITVAGIVGTALSWPRIASSNASTADPIGLRILRRLIGRQRVAYRVPRNLQRPRDRLDR